MNTLKHLFDKNRNWSEEIKKEDPNFFQELAKVQTPEYLWIGCADSRVPANQVIDLAPGSVFVHRNIANQVVHTDLNCLSVIQYAVEVLKVKHVIVCGHYGCGGVKAALGNQSFGLIDTWLAHIKDTARLHADELESLDEEAKFNLMCEINVVEQVNNVCSTSIVKNAWRNGADLSVHGCIYSLEDGLLKDLDTTVSSLAQFEERSGLVAAE